MVDQPVAVLLVQVDETLGVTLAGETVPPAEQRLPQRREVVQSSL
jgi:hypothetical protein